MCAVSTGLKKKLVFFRRLFHSSSDPRATLTGERLIRELHLVLPLHQMYIIMQCRLCGPYLAF